jgi:sugar PTS system EIIA component
MFKKLFGKEEVKTEETIVSPLTGTVVNLEEVPDPTFAKKMLGDGVAIKPTEGKVVSPIDGEVVNLFPTKHAIGIQGKSGLEVLIHIGLETVNMNGEGFEAHVSQGDKVKAGDLLVSFDLNLVEEKATSTITPVVFTNGDIIYTIEKLDATDAEKGSTELVVVKVKK